mgnify:FL=1
MTVSTIYKLAAEMSTRGNLPAGVMAANKQLKAMQSNLGGITSSVAGLGRSIGGSAFQTAGAIARGAGTAGAIAAGAAAGLMAKGGIAANAEMERMKNTIAGTLQLFDHSAGATDQLGANVKVAAQALKELNKIAVQSPGELEDVSKMFQNMLPGARGVTGDMQRIMKLTHNLALFTPTLTGGDFMTSGSQMGRILAGSAGAEMDTWKKLQPVISRLGKEAKIFKQSMGAGDDLTAAFNKLSGEDRMALIEKAFSQGGEDLAKMYASSWEGASAAAMSAVKQVRNALTAPIFNKIKEAMARHTGDKNSLLGEDRVEKMIKIAGQIGGLMAMPVERMLSKLAAGIRYVQENAATVVNRIYQGFQVAGAIIRGAAAFMLAKMMLGAGLIAAATAAKVGGAVGRGVKGAYQMTNSGIEGIRKGTKAVRGFMDGFKGQSAITRALGFVTMLGRMGGVMAVVVPMLAIAAVAFGLLAIPLLAAAGIAAYVASKWDELSASVVKGLKDGTITIRPLIIAALILWERLKKLGEAFIGGQTGATMMQKAINMATGVVNGLSEGVAIMAQVAAGLLRVVGKLANAYDSAFGESDSQRVAKRTADLMEGGSTFDDAMKRAQAEHANGFLRGQKTMGDEAIELAGNMENAAKKWRSIDLASISESAISSWTNTVTDKITSMFTNKEEPKVPKGPRVSVQNLYMTVDLRGEDPDRSLSSLIQPIEDLAKKPTSSTSDMVGGLGG